MDKMMKECMKPHALLHSVAGVGLGVLLTGFLPSLAANAVMIGLVLIIVGVGGEFLMKK